MGTLQRLKFSQRIEAPVEKVHRLMIAPDSYSEWTKPFTSESTYEGSWDEGATIRFKDGKGNGMISEIAEHRPKEYISIRHLGMIQDGVEDTTSDAVRAWAPSYENYTFTPAGNATMVDIELDVAPEWSQQMQEMWPRALAALKEISESD